MKIYKVLVTGGAGFIGSHLVSKLIELNHDVTVIDNECAKDINSPCWNVNAKNYKLDICDYEKTKDLYNGIDYVFHLAAEARIQPAIKNPIDAITKNVLGTCVVLQCSKEAGVKRVMYSSTSSAYGNNDFPNVETQPDDCLNPYSVSKVAGEKLCKMYNDLYGLKTIIFRYFNVYGERSPIKGQYAPVVGLFLKQYLNNEPLTIVGDGEQRRDFTNVLDVVDANVKAAFTDMEINSFGELYNIGNSKNYSINEIAKMISNNVLYIEDRLGESRVTLSNSDKFKKTFNWKPSIDIECWIKKQKKLIESHKYVF
jgi:UDP-glucose 4-epimerase